MRRAEVCMHGIRAGILEEIVKGKKYVFRYDGGYSGAPVSLTMPLSKGQYDFDKFPPFFEGLLPEGIQLEGLLRAVKLDRDDLFGQLAAVGEDVVGAATIKEEIVDETGQ